VQVVICTYCDRGNRYCSAECAQEARRQLQRAARRRYEQSDVGRRNNAARQKRHRLRDEVGTALADSDLPTVTDQGSPVRGQGAQAELPSTQEESSDAKSVFSEVARQIGQQACELVCRLCRRVRSFFLRFDFLSRHRRSRAP
jgi:hypothetical protein